MTQAWLFVTALIVLSFGLMMGPFFLLIEDERAGLIEGYPDAIGDPLMSGMQWTDAGLLAARSDAPAALPIALFDRRNSRRS